MTWEKKYRRGTKVADKQSHDEQHDRLLVDPEVGGRVERGSPLAFGYPDVHQGGITAELKVERKVPVTKSPRRSGLASPPVAGRRRRSTVDAHHPRHEPESPAGRYP